MTSPPPQIDGHALMEVFRRYLRDHSLPITHQREAVAAAVFFGGGHLSVGDIEYALENEGAHVGKATIYRTLELLDRAGLIEQHDFGEGFRRFEARSTQGHHEHLICVACGRVVEFSTDRLERMNALIAEQHGFRHHHHRLEIYGLCQACQGRDAATLEAIPPARTNK